VGRTRIGELPALFAACHLFIGNDSGAAHVAGAAGLGGIVVFGSSDAAGTAPVSPLFRVVQRHVACSPCFLRHCPIDHRCMTGVDTDMVYSAVKLELDAAGIRSAQ
jgi:heptosyltransferase-2